MTERPVGATVAAPPAAWRRRLTGPRTGVPAFLGASALVGALLGVVWAWGAERPGYRVRDDLSAFMAERALAQVFASDALFVGLAAALGLVAGCTSWVWFRRLGWWVCVLAMAAGLLGSLVAWQVGLLVAPPSFAERLAQASAGDVVPIDLALRTFPATMLVAPFLAITPLMLLAAFWPEDPAEAAEVERAGQLGEND